MKKPNLLMFFFTTILFALGITSCKKDCTDCVTFTDNYGDSYTYCEDNPDYTKEQYEAYLTIIKASGYTYNEFEECD